MLRLGIIGHPVHHTLSPALHAYLLQACGMQGEYKVYDIAPNALACSLQDFQEAGLHGLNVTIPHKTSVMPLCDAVTPEARLCGAVNTLVFDREHHTITGHNTDVIGFARSLPQHFTETLPQRHVLVLGAGGSARAVLVALLQFQAAAVTLAVRSMEKAVPVLGDFEQMKEQLNAATELSLVSFDSLPSLESFGGIINTTPVGMWPDTNFSPLPKTQLQTLSAGSLVYDLIYRPLETQFLNDADALGYPTQGGLRMLIHQGIAAFERWSGQTIDPALAVTLEAKLAESLASESRVH